MARAKLKQAEEDSDLQTDDNCSDKKKKKKVNVVCMTDMPVLTDSWFISKLNPGSYFSTET